MIAGNLALVRARIVRAAEDAARDPASVRLIAVSKTKPAEAVAAALAAGQRLFGENYAQELQEKCAALGCAVVTAGVTAGVAEGAAGALGAAGAKSPAPGLAAPEWHFLGALQSNKAKLVVGRAALIHTCDRLSLAEELQKQVAKLAALAPGFVQRVLIEVNLGREPQKGGCLPEALPALLRALGGLPLLRCEGLMTIPPAEGDPRVHFRALRALRDQALQTGAHPGPLPELSMGMSADFEAAIAEGATLVRVGTALFGARS